MEARELSIKNNISEETAAKLCENFVSGRKNAEKLMNSMNKSMEILLNISHNQLRLKVSHYDLKIAKANIFTRWYYRKKLKSFSRKLLVFENEIMPKYYINL